MRWCAGQPSPHWNASKSRILDSSGTRFGNSSLGVSKCHLWGILRRLSSQSLASPPHGCGSSIRMTIHPRSPARAAGVRKGPATDTRAALAVSCRNLGERDAGRCGRWGLSGAVSRRALKGPRRAPRTEAGRRATRRYVQEARRLSSTRKGSNSAKCRTRPRRARDAPNARNGHPRVSPPGDLLKPIRRR